MNKPLLIHNSSSDMAYIQHMNRKGIYVDQSTIQYTVHGHRMSIQVYEGREGFILVCGCSLGESASEYNCA